MKSAYRLLPIPEGCERHDSRLRKEPDRKLHDLVLEHFRIFGLHLRDLARSGQRHDDRKLGRIESRPGQLLIVKMGHRPGRPPDVRACAGENEIRSSGELFIGFIK